MVKKGSKCSEEGGNTISPSRSPKVKWCFTLNYGKKEETTKDDCIVLAVPVIDKIKEYCKFYIVSLECITRYHLQGYIETKKKMRFSQIKLILGDKAHIEPAKGNRDANKIYCGKAPLYTWKSEDTEKYTAEELGLITKDQLFDWQKEIIQIIDKAPEKRKIYWYWSKKGGVGKTEFIKYLCHHHNAQFVQGAKKDIMNCIMGNDNKVSIKEKLGLRPVIILGFSRSVEDYVSYDGIESLKDGIIFNSKYESRCEMIPTPHIFIFCNFEPDRDMMSKDRWVVNQIDGNWKSPNMINCIKSQACSSDESSDSIQRSHSSRRSTSVSSKGPRIEAPRGSSPSPGGRVLTSRSSSATEKALYWQKVNEHLARWEITASDNEK